MEDLANVAHKPQKNKYRPIIFWLSIYLIIFIGINCFVTRPVFDNDKEEEHYNFINKRYDLVALHYHNLLDKNPLSPIYNYYYLKSWADANKNGLYQFNTIDELFTKYENLSESKKPEEVPVGKLGLGMLHAFNKQYKKAEQELGEIQDESSWYYRFALADCYESQEKYDKATYILEQDIKNSKFTDVFYDALYSKIGFIYSHTRQYQKLGALISEAPAYVNINPLYKAQYFLFKGNLAYFLMYMASDIYKMYGPYEFLIDMDIALVGFFILFKIMQRKKLNILPLVTIFILSYVFYEIIAGVMRLTHYPFFYSKDGSAGKLIYYCFFVGPREELTKIIPFLIILWFTKLIREPIDYLFYASICALAFAVHENIYYFYQELPPVGSGRGIHLIPGHIFYTVLSVFGILTGKDKPFRLKVLYFLVFLILGSFLHGWSDFWPGYILGSHIVPHLILSIFFIITFAFMLESALLESTQANLKPTSATELMQYLFIAFFGIIMSDYTISAFIYGHDFTNSRFLGQFFTFILISALASLILAYITTQKSGDEVAGPDELDMLQAQESQINLEEQ